MNDNFPSPPGPPGGPPPGGAPPGGASPRGGPPGSPMMRQMSSPVMKQQSARFLQQSPSRSAMGSSSRSLPAHNQPAPNSVEQALLRQKSGMRRFSVTTLPHVHTESALRIAQNGEDEEYNEYDDEESSITFKPYFVEMQESLINLHQSVEEVKEKYENEGFQEVDDEEYQRQQQRRYREEMSCLPLDFDQNELLSRLIRCGGPNGDFVFKKGSKKTLGRGTSWKKRWIRLNLVPGLDPTGRALPPRIEYFSTGNPSRDQAAKGFISLSWNTQVHRRVERKVKSAKVNNMFLFFIEAHDKRNESRKFELACDTVDKANAWVDAISFLVHALHMHEQRFETVHDENQETDEEERERREDEAQSITATGSGLFEAIVGEKTTFQIEVTDPLTKEPRSFDESGLLDFYINLQSIDEDESVDSKNGDYDASSEKMNTHLHYDLRAQPSAEEEGIYDCEYFVSRVGKYKLSIMLQGYPIFGSPFTMVAIPGNAYAKCSVASGPGISIANWEGTNMVTVTTFDRLNTPLSEGGLSEKFLIIFDNEDNYSPASLVDNVQDNGDGSYSFEYRVDPNLVRGQRTMTLEIKIDDGTAFSKDTLEKVKNNNMDLYGQYEDEVQIERPAWPINIKGSPFTIPITNIQPISLPGAAADSLTSSRSPEQVKLELDLAEKEKMLAEEQERLAQMRLQLEQQMREVVQSPPPAPSPSRIAAVPKPITTPAPVQEARGTASGEQAVDIGGNRQQDVRVQKLFDQYHEPLSQVFAFYSPDRDTLDLSSFIQMGMDFDLYPTFVDKAELRNCFQEAQLKFSSLSDTVGYSGFVDALYLLAVASLSKKAFSNLYPTDSEKVNVLLGLWGLGDPLKLEQVKGKHRGL